MKLAPLLVQYLIANKRLDLPGVGSFMLDPSALAEPEGGKHNKPAITEGISFESNSSIVANPNLIDFISAQTGKMKALASADLNSHLELALQFLNIGKPFLLEGIGSLVKIRSGQYEFTAGLTISEKVKEYSVKEISATSSTEDSFTDYQSVFNPPKTKVRWRRPAMISLMAAGLLLAIWGGYTISKKTRNKDKVAVDGPKTTETILLKDSIPVKKDSAVELVQTMTSGNHKFVIEVAGRERGMQRFGTLRGYGLNVQMETKDSTSFKLFFLLPAALSDTARIRDSLSALYTPTWAKAYVEN